MVDRALVLHSIEPHIRPSGSQAESIRKLLDKALVEALQTLPLEAATSMPAIIRSDIAIAIRDLFGQKEAEKLSALWEPNRKLDADTKRHLRPALVDLLHGNRSVYQPPQSLTLESARGLSGADRLAFEKLLSDLAASAELKKLLKSWDPHLKPVPPQRADVINRLNALLEGAPPTVKPAPAKKAKR